MPNPNACNDKTMGIEDEDMENNCRVVRNDGIHKTKMAIMKDEQGHDDKYDQRREDERG